MGGNNSEYITYPSSIISALDGTGSSGGGIKASLIREITGRKLRGQSGLNIISRDRKPFFDPSTSTSVLAADTLSAKDRSALEDEWYNKHWALLHPEAYAEADKAIDELFPGEYTAPRGSQEKILEYLSGNQPLNGELTAKRNFVESLRRSLLCIPSGARLTWTDFNYASAVCHYTEHLRRLGIQQVYHNHMSVPDNLVHTTRGRELLTAMSMVDRVYVYIDEYKHRIESQLHALGLECPPISIFNTGPDLEVFSKLSERRLPDFSTLTQVQKNVVTDILKTTGSVAHRFVCLDRLDPIKGMHVVLEAIERFLSSQDLPLETLQKDFRFYFLAHFFDNAPSDESSLNAKRRYTKFVKEKLQDLVEKYPGIVMACDNIPIREMMGFLLRDAHLISGSIQEGLNFAIQEGAYVNAKLKHPRTIILGDGAGFAIQAKEDGHQDLAFFPKSGDVDEMVLALEGAIKLAPETLIGKTCELVEKTISTRTGWLIEN